MSETQELNHLGLFFPNLETSETFFVDAFGWSESGYDASSPRVAVSDEGLP